MTIKSVVIVTVYFCHIIFLNEDLYSFDIYDYLKNH